MSRVGAVVVAAGRGDRFGTAKQFVELGGRRLVDHAVDACRAVSDVVVVVIPDGEPWTGPAVDAAVVGGAARSDSVRAGLDALDRDERGQVDVVVVHDAARPLATRSVFDAVIDAVRSGADGAVPGVPVADTIKRVDGTRVIATVDRSDLVAVQTPQAFRADVLRRAHAAGADATDDAALVEAIGGTVVVVPGDPDNLKVTALDDLRRVEAIARQVREVPR